MKTTQLKDALANNSHRKTYTDGKINEAKRYFILFVIVIYRIGL